MKLTSSYAIEIKHINKLFRQTIKIYNDGGMIINTVVENEEGLKVIMVGNATFVYTATVKYEDNTISVSNKKEFVEENESYDKFLEFTNAVEK